MSSDRRMADVSECQMSDIPAYFTDEHAYAFACGWDAAVRKMSEGVGHSQTDRAPSDATQFGTPDVGYAMPAGGSTTWPESRVT